jgi:hypothetical protein
MENKGKGREGDEREGKERNTQRANYGKQESFMNFNYKCVL